MVKMTDSDGDDPEDQSFSNFQDRFTSIRTKNTDNFKEKSDIERISVCANLIKDFFNVKVDTNQTCHAFFSDKKSETVPPTNTK